MKNLGLLHDPSDIFMMMTDEIRAWINKDLSAQEIQDNVNYRKLMYAGYRNFTPPNELGEGVEQRTAASYSEGNRLLRGTGCSAGIVEGLVRIVPRLDEAGTLLEGEILVTQFTDPGWTPVLGRARGVITEIGGLLSHAAVIGREYGIPAVLNVRGVTQALKTGQKVRMNGQAGTIEVLSDG
jgi:phosphoenolpyruvate synthase/pyruvate phosphate dikinase